MREVMYWASFQVTTTHQAGGTTTITRDGVFGMEGEIVDAVDIYNLRRTILGYFPPGPGDRNVFIDIINFKLLGRGE